MSLVGVAFYLPPTVGSEHSEANGKGHAQRGGVPVEEDEKETETDDSLI